MKTPSLKAQFKTSRISKASERDMRIYNAAVKAHKLAVKRKLIGKTLGLDCNAVFGLLPKSILKMISGKDAKAKRKSYGWHVYKPERALNKGKPLSKNVESYVSHKSRYDNGLGKFLSKRD
jgi:hypothetical protein